MSIRSILTLVLLFVNKLFPGPDITRNKLRKLYYSRLAVKRMMINA